MAKHKISISFRDKYTDVYHFLIQMKDNKENVSDYICKLIELDMGKPTGSNSSLHEDIRKAIADILLLNPSITLPKEFPTTEKSLIDEDINLLNELF